MQLPKLNLGFGTGSAGYVGIDVGASSVKVVELRKEKDRAVLKSYGELKTAPYFKRTAEEISGTGGFLRYLETDIAAMLHDVLRESNITSKQAVFSIPTVSAFIMLIDFPRLPPEEINAAIPFEVKRYVPIPLSEISLDWEIIDEEEEKKLKVLFVAVPKEIINKYKRIGDLAKLDIRAVEVENFSFNRSLARRDHDTPTAIIHLGAQTTNITITKKGIIRASHNLERGSHEITRMLSRALTIDIARAEEFKRSMGLSDRPEEKEIVDVIAPVADSLFREILRIINSYNRSTIHKVERLILSGGGANLPGLVDLVTKLSTLETARANPFSKVTYPAFMQPILR
ncbi:MAG: hypothetical protein A2934_00710, partial [Candidatus Sungbacteria bacterium RIFCSPLOWO2_01_FULL_47_10]